MSDTIYRAMGWRWVTTADWQTQPIRSWFLRAADADTTMKDGTRFWRDLTDAEAAATVPFSGPPDPLTDWSAFGEILEWAEKWCDMNDYLRDVAEDMRLTGRTFRVVALDVLVQYIGLGVELGESPAALESAIGGTE